jgi:DNA-binding Lrp family transcriptional regulator
MQVRHKENLDGIDREILRILYKNGPLNARTISSAINLSPPAVSLRLNSLKKKGLVRIHSSLGIRIFRREFNGSKVKIKSPRSIYWEVDIED